MSTLPKRFRPNRVKTPVLMDASVYARKYPETFSRPDSAAISALAIGDHVKVCIPGERFWVQLTEVNHPILIGRVDGVLPGGPLRNDDLIKFHTDNIYNIWRTPKP